MNFLTERKKKTAAYPSHFRPVATIKREINSAINRRMGSRGYMGNAKKAAFANRYKQWKTVKDKHGPENANKWLGMHSYEADKFLQDLESPHPKHTKPPKEIHGFKLYDTDHNRTHTVHKYYHPSVSSAHVAFHVPLNGEKPQWKVHQYGRGRPHKLIQKFKANMMVESIDYLT